MIYKASASMMEPKSPKTPVAAMPEAELATARVLVGELPLLVEEAMEVRVVGLVLLDEPEVGLIPTVALLTGYGMEVAGVAAAREVAGVAAAREVAGVTAAREVAEVAATREVAGVAAALETGTTTDVVWAGAVTVLLIWVVERIVLALAVVDSAGWILKWLDHWKVLSPLPSRVIWIP